MATALFYFTGTGNTLQIAKDLAAQLPDATLAPIAKADPRIGADTDAVGILFPVYGWGMPKIVGEFVDRMENLDGKYVFAVCNYGGTLFASLKTVQKRFRRKGIALSAGFGIRMPVNYIQIFTVLSRERQDRMLAKAREKVGKIASVVKNRQKAGIECWPVPLINGLLMAMNKQMINNIGKSDKNYWVDEKCNGCGLCVDICPVKNVVLKNDRPSWNHTCQQCMACLHWCPQKAVQYGKVPAKRGRYHNPFVTIKEIMEQR
jgi:ferredoxin